MLGDGAPTRRPLKPIQLLLRFAYTARRARLGVTGWRTRGVRAMVFDAAGRVLLVRHSYAARDQWMLPGGGIAKRESAAAAAEREVREETGCRLTAVELLGVFDASEERWRTPVQLFDGVRDTVYLFGGTTADVPKAGSWEITHACFWPVDALPPRTSPATRRRVAEWQADRYADLW
jgi:8-oxo-dGTP pyrophosphatase MutT (NUDIX family)